MKADFSLLVPTSRGWAGALVCVAPEQQVGGGPIATCAQALWPEEESAVEPCLSDAAYLLK